MFFRRVQCDSILRFVRLSVGHPSVYPPIIFFAFMAFLASQAVPKGSSNDFSITAPVHPHATSRVSGLDPTRKHVQENWF